MDFNPNPPPSYYEPPSPTKEEEAAGEHLGELAKRRVSAYLVWKGHLRTCPECKEVWQFYHQDLYLINPEECCPEGQLLGETYTELTKEK